MIIPHSEPTMKTIINICLSLACVMQVSAEHPTPEIAGLQKAAADFVTAVLIRETSGAWRIASTRSLKDVTEAAGHLAALADALKGEWTHREPEGVRLDLAFGWDSTGTYITGEMLTTTADAEPQDGGNMHFVLIGAPDGDPGLDFVKN